MEHFFPEYTQCLTHQLPEDQCSPAGMVCPLCKQRIYISPPEGRSFSCWESQPGAYTLNGEPCFVYTIVWEDFRIRSLHPAGVLIDPRSVNGAVIVDIDGLSAIEFPESIDTPPERMGEMPDEGFSLPEDFAPPDDDEFGLWREDAE